MSVETEWSDKRRGMLCDHRHQCITGSPCHPQGNPASAGPCQLATASKQRCSLEQFSVSNALLPVLDRRTDTCLLRQIVHTEARGSLPPAPSVVEAAHPTVTASGFEDKTLRETIRQVPGLLRHKVDRKGQR